VPGRWKTLKIDNSQMQAFWYCPQKWEERYVNNLEPRVRDTSSLEFGTRMHQLLEDRHLDQQGLPQRWVDSGGLTSELEAEAQLTFEAYCAYYPEEPWDVVAVEQYFEVPLLREQCPHCQSRRLGVFEESPYCFECEQWFADHIYNGEFDAIVRMKDSGRLYILETKTESRSSKSNSPEAWISRSQVGLYQWAAEKIYGEEFEGIILNVISRQSPKGNCAPCFRRDTLHRTKAQQLDAVKNIIWVADQIEAMQRIGFFPSNRNNCVTGYGWKCDFHDLHVTPEGRPSDELIQIRFKQAEQYLAGDL